MALRHTDLCVIVMLYLNFREVTVTPENVIQSSQEIPLNYFSRILRIGGYNIPANDIRRAASIR